MEQDTYSEATAVLQKIGTLKRRIGGKKSFDPEMLKVYIKEYPELFDAFVSAVMEADKGKLADLEKEFDNL